MQPGLCLFWAAPSILLLSGLFGTPEVAALRLSRSAHQLYYGLTFNQLRVLFSTLDYASELTRRHLLPLLRNTKYDLSAAYGASQIEREGLKALVEHYKSARQHWGCLFPYELMLGNPALDELLPDNFAISSVYSLSSSPEDVRQLETRPILRERTMAALLETPVLAGPYMPEAMAWLASISPHPSHCYWELGRRNLEKNPIRSAIFTLLDRQFFHVANRLPAAPSSPEETAQLEQLFRDIYVPEKLLETFRRLRRHLAGASKAEDLSKPLRAYWKGLLLSLAISIVTQHSNHRESPYAKKSFAYLERSLRKYLLGYGTQSIPLCSRVRVLRLAYECRMTFEDDSNIIAIIDDTQRHLPCQESLGGSWESRHRAWTAALYRMRKRIVPPPARAMNEIELALWWNSYEEDSLVDHLFIDPGVLRPLMIAGVECFGFRELVHIVNEFLTIALESTEVELDPTFWSRLATRTRFTNLFLHKTMGFPLPSSSAERSQSPGRLELAEQQKTHFYSACVRLRMHLYLGGGKSWPDHSVIEAIGEPQPSAASVGKTTSAILSPLLSSLRTWWWRRVPTVATCARSVIILIACVLCIWWPSGDDAAII